MGDTSEEFERAATEIGGRLYGETPIAVRLPSRKNVVFRLEFPDGRPDKVIKLAGHSGGATIRHEQRVLGFLGRPGWGLGVPPVEHTQEDVSEAPVPFTVMPALPGSPLDGFRHADAAPIRIAYRGAGEFLARLSRHQFGSDQPGYGGDQVRGWMRDEVEHRCADLEAAGLLTTAARERIESVRKLVDMGPTGFAHRDFNPGQVVVDERGGVRVIDWEEAGLGYPMLNCADFVKLARENDVSAALIDEFLGAFRSGYGWSPQREAEYQAWQAYSFLGAAQFYLGKAKGMVELADRMDR